ncbi:uncharacterized protein BXZ73DRAFT_55561 [Epithele typhae]|uniref:uncharacterized protein n=1 Tax=Epithele typhae TaxID=378194 RepID=UPI00200894CE|nr:uncharacterized protein BXZ73DRAFT_55561 [Epithele typhae]KAH9913345.1 hypothetical protein BXZ73DRAFT_55561 [Epithele typhae]
MADAAPLPLYSDVQAAHRSEMALKQKFARILDDQLDIEDLFRNVAAQLEGMRELGPARRTLVDGWERLRQRHRQTYKDSQQNAGMCAHFMRNFTSVLVPLSQSVEVSSEQKTMMIGKFLETIPIHLNTARENAENFNELAKEVHGFPLKVHKAVNAHDDKAGIWGKVWSVIEKLCAAIWKALNDFLMKILDTFKDTLGRLNSIHLTYYGARLDMYFTPYQSLEPEKALSDVGSDVTLHEAADNIEANTRTLSEKLTAFESAWHVVELACTQLSSDLDLAKSFSAMGPPVSQASDGYLRAAALVHAPLVECLTAYSLGRFPDFA